MYRTLLVWLCICSGMPTAMGQIHPLAFPKKLPSPVYSDLTLALKQPKKVERLALKNLTILPASIGKFTHLKELDLRGSSLTSLPAELARLKQLQVLNLQGNPLMGFPSVLLQLSQLHTLILAEKELTTIPQELNSLTQLTHVRLDSNQLRNLRAKGTELKGGKPGHTGTDCPLVVRAAQPGSSPVSMCSTRKIVPLSQSSDPLPKAGDLSAPFQSSIGKLDGIATTPLLPVANLELSATAEKAGTYAKDIQHLSEGNLKGIKELPVALEHTAESVVGMDQINQRVSTLDPVTQAIQHPQQVQQRVVEQAKKVAIDHFAGKEDVLRQAMEKLSKQKDTYASLSSWSEIEKKHPNAMRGKPLAERLVPSIAIQIQGHRPLLLLDVNPALGYRLSGQWITGLGWNQRIGYQKEANRFSSQSSLYGPRIFAEVKLKKGLMPRTELEAMHTFIPASFKSGTPDPSGRAWVTSVLVGLKKEYRFLKSVRGTTMLMLRVVNYPAKNPYASVLNLRLGFEFPAKKKPAMVKPTGQAAQP